MVDSVNSKQPSGNTNTSAPGNQASPDAAGANQFQSLLHTKTGSGDDQVVFYGNPGGSADTNTGSGDDVMIYGAPPMEEQPQQAGGQQQPADGQQQAAGGQQQAADGQQQAAGGQQQAADGQQQPEGAQQQPADSQQSTPTPPQPGPTSLVIDTGSGDDRVEINGGLPQNTQIKTGSGDDGVAINAAPAQTQQQPDGGQQQAADGQQAAGGQQPAGTQQQTTAPPQPGQTSLVIDTGDGDDQVEINGGLAQNTEIKTGSGDDGVAINAAPAQGQQAADGQQPTTPPQPGSSLVIDTGDGDDQVGIDGGLAENNEIKTGAGDDGIVINGPGAEDLQTPTNETAAVSLKIDSGSEDDYVEYNGLRPQELDIKTRSGDDQVVVNLPPTPPPPQPQPSDIEDPIVLDMDRDGVVEATAGTGVDINGDGKLDGAATGGDKMLAMTDLNGNGNIDGAEVFGNETINPFTGEKLNAPNGFEALKMIAQSAEEHTGIDCMDDEGQVDMQKLKAALETVGVGLGLISDDNTTTLESLGDVAAVDTDYVEQEDNGDVQHRQLGNYTTTDGETHKADDVWFKS